jgi:hypothetical protein
MVRAQDKRDAVELPNLSAADELFNEVIYGYDV